MTVDHDGKIRMDGSSPLCNGEAGWLDHFRGFAATWHVPAGAPTAQSVPFTFFTPHYDIAREYFPFF